MFTTGFWPLMALIALVLVALACSGNDATSTSQSLPDETMGSVVITIGIIVAAVLSAIGWLADHVDNGVAATVTLILMTIIALAGVCAILISAAVKVFFTAVSSTVEVDKQHEQTVYRRVVQWLETIRRR